MKPKKTASGASLMPVVGYSQSMIQKDAKSVIR